MFTLRIETKGAAFTDNGEPAVEVATLLRGIANDVRSGKESGKVIDTWGNSCGEWALTDETDPRFKVGAPDWTPADPSVWCGEQDPASGCICTAPDGHAKRGEPHVAGGESLIAAVWEA